MDVWSVGCIVAELLLRKVPACARTMRCSILIACVLPAAVPWARLLGDYQGLSALRDAHLHHPIRSDELRMLYRQMQVNKCGSPSLAEQTPFRSSRLSALSLPTNTDIALCGSSHRARQFLATLGEVSHLAFLCLPLHRTLPGPQR